MLLRRSERGAGLRLQALITWLRAGFKLDQERVRRFLSVEGSMYPRSLLVFVALGEPACEQRCCAETELGPSLKRCWVWGLLICRQWAGAVAEEMVCKRGLAP